MRRTITDDLVTGYRFAGIEQAAALHRLLYGTRETGLLMCGQLCGNPERIGRQFGEALKFIPQLNL
jgi:hypothetical protein